jgi:poly-gamma-glutamate synthesis protein (capsule biosynthesis protein)
MWKYWLVISAAVGIALIIALMSLIPSKPVPATTITGSFLPAAKPLTVLFVGDIMLDRNVAVHAAEAGDASLFNGVKDMFFGNDVLVGNLEGTLTTNASVAQQDHSVLRFTFDPHFAEVLANLGFSAVSLANNHALDFGEFGYDDTVFYLHKAGIAAFGSPFNEQHLAVQLTAQNKKLCLVGYHSLFRADYSMVVAKIISVRLLCDYIVVMSHWGEEYQHEPILQQREAAHAFVDAGADVVIGGHPHVAQPVEIYNNHAIFYSLGNFLFDQGFSAEVKRGLAVTIKFTKESTRFVLTPVNTYKEASVAEGGVAEAVLQDLLQPGLPTDIQNSIVNTGSFELRTAN